MNHKYVSLFYENFKGMKCVTLLAYPACVAPLSHEVEDFENVTLV